MSKSRAGGVVVKIEEDTMTSKNELIPQELIEHLRREIRDHFADAGKCPFGVLRGLALDTLNKLIEGDVTGARTGMQKLGPEGARWLQNKFRQIGIDLELA